MALVHPEDLAFVAQAIQNDFGSLLERVRDGAEVVIEHGARPIAVVRPLPLRLPNKPGELTARWIRESALCSGRQQGEVTYGNERTLSRARWGQSRRAKSCLRFLQHHGR